MRRISTSAIGTAILVALASTASLKGQPGQDKRPALPGIESPAGMILWNQYGCAETEPPINIGSQDFEPALDALDDQAADDFVLPDPGPGINIYITAVRVMGEYSDGGGPAASFNVYFYNNSPDNLPGTLIAAFVDLPYTGTPPDFTITLPNEFGIGLSPGTYWVSVQARQDFNPNGQWSWHNCTVQVNAAAAWQNPGDGYGTGCITWNRKNACMVDQVAPDQVFQIIGYKEGNPPSPTPWPTPTPTPTLPPCAVSSEGCGSIVTTPPTDFNLNVSESVDPATVDASDFTVNGIPADSATVINGNTVIDFTFSTSPALPGVNNMHIAAGAFDCIGGPVAEFNCTFFYNTPTPTPTATPTRPTPPVRARPTPLPRADPAVICTTQSDES